MRRRRKRGGAWLPVNPTTFGETNQERTWFTDNVQLPAGAEPGDGIYAAVPITLDQNIPPAEATVANTVTLRDWVEGQDYLLHRVVGKVFVGLAQNEEQDAASVIATVGFAVLPTEPGSNSPSTGGDDWNPVAAENAQEPWIWRRQWALSNQLANIVPDPGIPSLAYPVQAPTNNMQYGSVMDGPHIDTKSKRRVTREHRLYIVYGFDIDQLNNIAEGTVPTVVTFTYDVRINGAMRRARNRSSF